ncbi:MAG: hypothetical protein K1V69_00100, partial [Alistipes sp.]
QPDYTSGYSLSGLLPATRCDRLAQRRLESGRRLCGFMAGGLLLRNVTAAVRSAAPQRPVSRKQKTKILLQWIM